MQSVIPAQICDSMIAEFEKMAEEQISENTADPLKYSNNINTIAMGQHMVRNVMLRNPEMFMPTIDIAPVMAVLDAIIDDTVILEGSSANNAVAVDGNYSRLIHIDSNLAPADPTNTLDVVAFLCMSDFTATNGATRIWPKTHKSGIQIHRDPAYKDKVPPGHVELIAPKGSIAFVLGHTWHQMGENIDHTDRWVLLNHYKRWWIKPSTDYTKCGPQVFEQLTDAQKVLLGFNSIPPKDQVLRYKTLIKVDEIPGGYEEALSN